MTIEKKLVRDENGLIEGVDYKFHEDGSINWRAMIKPEFLVPNKDKTKETDTSKLQDKDLIILLGGIKELAQIRGYTDVSYDVSCPSSDYVASVCSISWIPNYETEGRPVRFSAIGDASPNNTKSFARNFLGPIAENRSFVRCVRNFLKINIVSQEELGDKMEDVTSASFEPYALLSQMMSDKKISFEKLKAKLVKENFPGAQELTEISQIPKIKVFELLERIGKL